MGTAGDLELLRVIGEDLAGSAVEAGMAAPVPSCPGWAVRDLLLHVGTVHRWASTIVGECRTGPAVESSRPPEHELVEWYRHGHASLLDTLASAPADVACWSFLPGPSPLRFWIRRQLHETAVHRVDAGLANGETVTFEPDLAADGIDELLVGFLPRPSSRIRQPVERSVLVQATDAARAWMVVVGPGPPTGHEVTPGSAVPPADCTVRGSATDLYLVLWNRRDRSGLDLAGDVAVLEAWRTQMHVGWR